jgi:hypothetical protein
MKNEENEETKFKNPSEKRKERERDRTARPPISLFLLHSPISFS